LRRGGRKSRRGITGIRVGRRSRNRKSGTRTIRVARGDRAER
jgi:hypothetical protein